MTQHKNLSDDYWFVNLQNRFVVDFKVPSKKNKLSSQTFLLVQKIKNNILIGTEN